MKEGLLIEDNDYINQRLCNQIDWYSDKSTSNKRLYYGFQGAVLVFAATIPILACFAFQNRCVAITIGILAAIVVCLEGISKMCKFHENWIQYRFVSELLKHEKYLYLTKTAPYDSDRSEAFNYLVERSERIISSENINWVGITDDRS